MTSTASTWKETTLGELGVELQHGFTFPSGDLSPEGDLPVIRIGNVQRGEIVIDDRVRYKGTHKSEKFAKQTISKGDLLMALTGGDESNLNTATGRVGRYKNDEPALLNQRVAKIVPSKEVDADFLYYFLSQPSITRHLAATANGSVQRNLTNGHILGLEIALPEPAQQTSIADVFASLDRKIELLRRQNTTAEEIAQRIFNAFFTKHIEQGGVPDGWQLMKIGQVSDVSIGRTPPRKEKEWFSLNPSDKKWISIKDLGVAGAYINTSSEYLTAEAVQRFRVPLIPRGTVVVSFKLTVGRVAIAAEDMYSNEAIAHIKTSTLPTEYVYLFFKSFDFDSLGSTSSIATATNSETIRQIEIPIPDSTSLSKFTDAVSPLFSKIFLNTQTIEGLTVMRDALLLRLMSRELQIKH